MGGKAAKERRRVERLGKYGESSNNDNNKKGGLSKHRKPIGMGRNATKVSTSNERHSSSRTFTKKEGKKIVPKSFVKESSVESSNVKVKEKTFKKPKHLKRKLDQAEDEVTKTKLAMELQKLEDKKKGNLTHKAKKQKLEGYDSREKKKERDFELLSLPKESQQKDEQTFTKTAAIRKDESIFPKDIIIAKDLNLPRVEVSPDTKCVKSPEKELTLHPREDKTEKNVEDEGGNVNDGSDRSTSSDDSISVDLMITKRQRGRRRKGLLDTQKRIESNREATKQIDQEGTPTPEDQQKENRRCLGRKPITEFVLGHRYPGKVVYIKPFGVFIDINCHSEVFCHVSRVQDDYVKTPDEILKIGDDVNPRVVEIDRRKKRITVSLQSDKRIADERASLEAHAERKFKRDKSRKRKPVMAPLMEVQAIDENTNDQEPSLEEEIGNTLVDDEGNFLKSEADMSPSELKRARKLARRAQRRIQQRNSEVTSNDNN